MLSMKRNSTKTVILLTASMILTGSALAQQTPPAKSAQAPSATAPATTPAPAANQPSAFTSTKDKASYAIGISIARTLQRDGLEVNPTILMRGMQDALADGKLLMTEDEAKTALTE